MKKIRKRLCFQIKRFFPQPSGRIVASFLDNYFNKYMNYNFTAEKEDELDLIAMVARMERCTKMNFGETLMKK